MKNIKISTVIITLNEEKDIGRCLKSVKDISDEIIVVDSYSTDKTIDIAKKFGAVIYQRKFDSYDKQKDYATSKARSEWIFSLDADEIATKKLCGEIKGAVKNDDYDGYLIPRRNIIFGAEIKHTRWSPDIHIWLWRKGKGHWTPGVHSEVQVKGKVGRLKSGKVHYQYETVPQFFQMLNKYTEAEANEKMASGVRFSALQLVCQPVYNFLVRYFYRQGFLDGWRGFILSYLMAVYHLSLWVKVWEKQNVRI